VASEYLAPTTSEATSLTGAVPAVIDDDADRLRLGLIALATLERELILKHFAARTVSGRIVELLLENVGQLIDRTRAKGLPEYLQTAHEIVSFSWRFRLAHFLHRRFAIEFALEDDLANRFERLLVSRIVLEELTAAVAEKLGPIVGARLMPQLLDVLRQRLEMTGSALEALGVQYPAYAVVLERRFLKRIALRHQGNEQKTLFEEWVLTAKFHDYPEGWIALFREAQYTGDYYWTIIE
jgi:CPA1 family monovalent cation:H+ antiporter